MSDYNDILKAIGDNGSGVRECDQRTFLLQTKSYGSEGLTQLDWKGICRGLVGIWLIDKKVQESYSWDKARPFWTVFSESPDEKSNLLESMETSRSALQLQREYIKCENNFEEYLGSEGLIRVSDEDKDWITGIDKDMTRSGIATSVLTSKSRFYRLSIRMNVEISSYKGIKS
jgi:hypothetical protein